MTSCGDDRSRPCSLAGMALRPRHSFRMAPPRTALFDRRSAAVPRRPGRNVALQLVHRELGLGSVQLCRRHLSAFRLRFLEASKTPDAEHLEFLRAAFCCIHLAACFERQAGQEGCSLRQQFLVFFRMLREPDSAGELSAAVARKRIFFDHLVRLGLPALARELLQRDLAGLDERLFLRNKMLWLRLLRRLAHRSLGRMREAVLDALATDEAFLGYCFQLSAFPSLSELAASLLEEVLHHRDSELALAPFADFLGPLTASLAAPQAAKLNRVLTILCAGTTPQAPGHLHLASCTATSAANQELLLRVAPTLLDRIVEVLELGMVSVLPRRPDCILEEAHWTSWLDEGLGRSDNGDFVSLAITKIVSLADLVQTTMLLRVLQRGPAGAVVRQRLLDALDIGQRLRRFMDVLVWRMREGPRQVDLLWSLEPETPLKLQVVRCVAHLFEDCSPKEKRFFLSAPELHRLRCLNDFLPADERDPVIAAVEAFRCCPSGRGLLSGVVAALIQQPFDSAFRLWLSRCVEGYLLGLSRPKADQQLLALMEEGSRTLLEDQLLQCLAHERPESAPNRGVDLFDDLSQQGADTLALLVKFNPQLTDLLLRSATALPVLKVPDLPAAAALVRRHLTTNPVTTNVLLRALALSEAGGVALADLPALLCSLLDAVRPCNIDHSNVSCLNTLMMVLARRRRAGQLPRFLLELQAAGAGSSGALAQLRGRLGGALRVWRQLYEGPERGQLAELAPAWRLGAGELRDLARDLSADLEARRFPFVTFEALRSARKTFPAP